MIPDMYLLKSSTTATLQHCPAREVPQPRGSRGALNSRQGATAASTSSTSRGMTTPIGIWREFESSVALKARRLLSKRTSPWIHLRSVASSARVSTRAAFDAGARSAKDWPWGARIGGRSDDGMPSHDLGKHHEAQGRKENFRFFNF